MRPYTAYFEYAVQQGFNPLQRCIRGRATYRCPPRANDQHYAVFSVILPQSLDLAVLASSLGELTANVSSLLLETVTEQSKEQHRSAASVCNRSTRFQSQLPVTPVPAGLSTRLAFHTAYTV
jgi:hypothetical protein